MYTVTLFVWLFGSIPLSQSFRQPGFAVGVSALIWSSTSGILEAAILVHCDEGTSSSAKLVAFAHRSCVVLVAAVVGQVGQVVASELDLFVRGLRWT